MMNHESAIGFKMIWKSPIQHLPNFYLLNAPTNLQSEAQILIIISR